VPAAVAPVSTAPASFTERLLAPVETAVALGTSTVTAPIVEGAKIIGTLASGKFGTQEGIRAGEATGRRVQQFFQPALSPTAQAQTQAISNALASTGIQGVPFNVLSDLSRATSAARQAAPLVTAPIEARQQRVQQQRVAQSYANAPMIDAVQSAQRIGAAVPPAISNPTPGNVLKGKLAGPELEQRLVRDNEVAVTNAVRKDLGVKPTERLIPEVDEVTGKLNPNSPISRALDEASAPYEPIRRIAALNAPKESIDALTALKQQAPIGGETKTAAINSLIDEAIAKLQQTTAGPFSGVGGGSIVVGRSGAAVLDDIRSLRRDAQVIYRAQKVNPDPLAIARADTQMGIANILEDVIDANATSPQMLSNFKKARTRIAQIYDHERAINYGLQKIDPQVYAKLFEERKGSMTGVGADIARPAAMFPDYFTLTPVQIKGLPRITRGGAGAAIGGAILAPLGPVAALAGTAAGMALGATAGARSAKQIASPAYQRANAMPPDYRPVPMGATPGEVRYGPNALVPYNYSQETFVPPNFVMVPEQYGPRVTTSDFVSGPAQIGMAQGPVGGQMGALRIEDARRAALSRTMGQQAEAQQAAAEAAARRPTAGETILEFDPVTGRFRTESQGLPGATPATFQDFGSSLKSAADKATAGRMFDMTAAEKVAWSKTKVDLAEVAPGFKSLNDKAIAAKMMDRQWVAETAQKAREKAAMFDEQSKRDVSAQAKRAAAINRDKMLDTAEMLDEIMQAPRPDVSGKQQGPKTREAIRNRLRGGDNTNALAR
jgi:hypothetical protein